MLLENRNSEEVAQLNAQLFGTSVSGLASVPKSAMDALDEMRQQMKLPPPGTRKVTTPARPKAGDAVPFDLTASKMPTSTDMAEESAFAAEMLARFRKTPDPPGD